MSSEHDVDSETYLGSSRQASCPGLRFLRSENTPSSNLRVSRGSDHALYALLLYVFNGARESLESENQSSYCAVSICSNIPLTNVCSSDVEEAVPIYTRDVLPVRQ